MLNAEACHEFVKFVRSIYGEGFIPLHRPVFKGNEKAYLSECIDSNFVSSAGQKIEDFENIISEYTGSKYAIATTNGTSALHLALLGAGVNEGEEVITQAVTFIATANAISYIGADPVFVDVERDTMGLNPQALKNMLNTNYNFENGVTTSKRTGKKLSACVPMHTFGTPCRIEEIGNICSEYNIPLIEDAAESLGSKIGDKHTGTFGLLGTFSFNGNKIITTGGGGMVITDDSEVARRIKHSSTTSKIAHPYEYIHDEIGYNYRLPNLNAALGIAQIERLDDMLCAKRIIADRYNEYCSEKDDLTILPDRTGVSSNKWLVAVRLCDRQCRDEFLQITNENGVMTRPLWRLMSELPMFKRCANDGLVNSHWLADRVVAVPSSVP